jgi:hypothetical protein
VWITCLHQTRTQTLWQQTIQLMNKQTANLTQLFRNEME